MILTAVLLSAAAAAPGCVLVDGDRILARQLAGADPRYAEAPSGAVVGFAPVPGARRILHWSELQKLSMRLGLKGDPTSDICVERVTAALSQDAVRAAMEKSLAGSEARIEVVEVSRFPVPRGELEFATGGLQMANGGRNPGPALWKGYVRNGGGRRFPVWARVRVTVRTAQVVAAEALRPGVPIEASQVRLEWAEGTPRRSGDNPTLEAVVGLRPRRAIAAGGLVSSALLDTPPTVEKGDLLRVEMRQDALVLKLDAVAESAARAGDVIAVRNVSSRKTFSARVLAKGQAVAEPISRSASRYRRRELP